MAVCQILRSMTWRHPKVWTPRISGCWRWAVAPLHLLRSGITPVPRIPGQMKTPWACQRPPSPCGNVGEWLMLLKSSAPRSQELTKALERAAVAACCRSFCEQSSDVIRVVQLEWPPWNFDIRKTKTVRGGKHTMQIIASVRFGIQQTNQGYFPHLVFFWHVESVLAGQDGSGEFASYLDLETWEGFRMFEKWEGWAPKRTSTLLISFLHRFLIYLCIFFLPKWFDAEWVTFCQTRAGEWGLGQFSNDLRTQERTRWVKAQSSPSSTACWDKRFSLESPKGSQSSCRLICWHCRRRHILVDMDGWSGERDWTRWNTLKLCCDEWPSVCLQVSSMTELFRTLRIAEEICLKLSFISGLTCLVVCLWQLINRQVRGLLSAQT